MNGTKAGEQDVQEIISKSRAEFERRRWILITNVPDNVDLEVRKLILMIVNTCSHPSAWNLIFCICLSLIIVSLPWVHFFAL